ncbi:MAG: cytochrome c [Saprospiraceae bacterium]|nr:cytochrome c [Saprospiraceae bacterium]
MVNHRYPRYIFLFLCISFLSFSISIYIKPLYADAGASPMTLMDGRLVWQRYNCQSCHQLYGLGGHLGPDLTNVYSKSGKGSKWISAIITTGVAQMPAFTLKEDEMEQLIEFLKQTDACGSADPRSFKILNDGMCHQKQ